MKAEKCGALGQKRIELTLTISKQVLHIKNACTLNC